MTARFSPLKGSVKGATEVYGTLSFWSVLSGQSMQNVFVYKALSLQITGD